jgi:hypothetical protein
MLSGIRVKQVNGGEDNVTLRFRCRGDTETNYDGFLGDATNAVTLLYENYGTGVVRKAEDRGRLQQRVVSALDHIFKDLR